MVLATRYALAADADLLPVSEREAIAALVNSTEDIARGDNHHAIDDAVKALADGTEQFAAMRMNRGIRAALAGRSIEEV
jgi:molecular chaperone HscA